MNEITIIMGYNAAGKSTLVEQFVNKGYHRINRDTTGGSLSGQVKHVREAFGKKITKVVLDNTYRNRESRAPLLEYAKAEGVRIRCVHLQTSFEDAQLNACIRQVAKLGRLLMPEEYKTIKDPNLFPPAALFSYRKQFEEPTLEEGFCEIELHPFVRRPLPAEYKNAALILDYDDNLRTSTGKEKYPCDPNDIRLLPGRTDRIQRYMKENKVKLLLGASNQSGIGKGIITQAQAEACFAHTNKLLGLEIDVQFCPHNSPPKCFCYCRKPAPGMAVVFIEKYKLDPKQVLFVGDQTSDKTWAERAGFQFQHTSEFFK